MVGWAPKTQAVPLFLVGGFNPKNMLKMGIFPTGENQRYLKPPTKSFVGPGGVRCMAFGLAKNWALQTRWMFNGG